MEKKVVVTNLVALNAVKKVTLLENAQKKMMAVHVQEKLVASNAVKKVTFHENAQKEMMAVHLQEKLVASNAEKKVTSQENVQVVMVVKIQERDKEKTMMMEMKVAIRDKDQMRKTTRITNGEKIELPKHNFKQVLLL